MKHARSHWRAALLVCGKCSKKMGGGFGDRGRDRLAAVLRAEPGFGKGRKADIGVLETKCLGLCPKHGVAVIDTRRPGQWLIVQDGDDAARLVDTLSADLPR
ncbi:hypothetical protein [Sphingomonas sp. TZW2008]|uniref:hypothetical protein n=1 Tax=Sphingomonas sp. TZW2008 TaxID=1917973 RepID=UPI000A271310|nr:hypothetical protein [Sphingomonas sp. TZW2008]